MTYSTLHAAAYLHHIELESSNPQRLAKFYGDAMQMQVEKHGDVFVCQGPQRRLIVSKGQDKKLALGAFACRDAEALEGLRSRAAKEGLNPQDAPSLLMDKAFSVIDPDGNRILFGLGKADPEGLKGLKGPTQHLTLATHDPEAIEAFYAGKLGFAVSDRVRKPNGEVATIFTRSNHEHHTLACFRSDRVGVDHHSYEASEWNVIRDWSDHHATLDNQMMWGTGRHGPGNNTFNYFVGPNDIVVEYTSEVEQIDDNYVARFPSDWTWPPGRIDQWGISPMPHPTLKEAQKKVFFETPT
jgi:catechol 2,3-dioxygenase-like lactoylglutathione lyase family enzyme